MVALNTVQNIDQDAGDLVSITEAASLLHITRDAIRMRIRRGTLSAVKREGQWYVSVQGTRPGEQTVVNDQDVHANETQDTVPVTDLVAQLRDEVTFLRGDIAFLREELRRKDTLLAALTQRVPLLEAPETQPTMEQQQATKRRRWWHVFSYAD